MNEMIRRAVEALSECNHDQPTEANLEAMVLAVIKSIREPTDAMVRAADEADYQSSEGVSVSRIIGSDGIKSMWRAAVDEMMRVA
jgi:hypothetical protein